MITRKVKLTVTLFIIIIILLGFYRSKKVKNRSQERFDRFYSTEINGKISCPTMGSVSGTKLCVDSKEYYFQPYTSKLNEHNIFSQLAQPGDIVSKPSFSDTLILFSQEKTYKYTFQKIQ